MDIESQDLVELISSDMAFKEAAKQYLMMATIDWSWRVVTDDVSESLALNGISESFILEIWTDLKNEIEKHLDIRQNDTIYLAYVFLSHGNITKDKEGKISRVVTEYVVPKYIINPATNKAIKLDNGME
jgi:hypothetical protein